MVANPIDAKSRRHKVSLQSLGNLQLDRIEGRTGSLHVQPNRRLQSPLPFDAIDFDASTGDRQERPNTVQDYVDLFLVQGWTFRHGLNDFLDFRNFFFQSSFYSNSNTKLYSILHTAVVALVRIVIFRCLFVEIAKQARERQKT